MPFYVYTLLFSEANYERTKSLRTVLPDSEEGHPVDRVEQSFATASQKILTVSANADIVESVTIESDDDNLSFEHDSENTIFVQS